MSSDRHITDIVLNSKTDLPLNGSLDEFQSGFSLDGFMGFRWSSSLAEYNGGVHIFPAEETNTKFNRVGLFTGVDGIEISPITSQTRFLGITVNDNYSNISYINELGFNSGGDLSLNVGLQTDNIYSDTDLLIEAKNSGITLKTATNGTLAVTNGTRTAMSINVSTGAITNSNLIDDTAYDISQYADNQLVTAKAIRDAIISGGNPSQGVLNTLNVSKGDGTWESRTVSVTEDASSVTVNTTKATMNIEALTGITLTGAAQSLQITTSLIAPTLDSTAIESNAQSLITWQYAEDNYADTKQVLINGSDSTEGFLSDKLQAGDNITLAVDTSNPNDYKLVINSLGGSSGTVTEFDPIRNGFENQNFVKVELDDVAETVTVTSLIEQQYFSDGQFTSLALNEVLTADLSALGFVSGGGFLYLSPAKTFTYSATLLDNLCPILIFYKDTVTGDYVFSNIDINGIAMDSDTKQYINGGNVWIYDGIEMSFNPASGDEVGGVSVYPSTIVNEDKLHQLYSTYSNVAKTLITPTLVYLKTAWTEYDNPEFGVQALTTTSWWEEITSGVDNSIKAQDNTGGLKDVNTGGDVDTGVWYYIFARADARADDANDDVKVDDNQYIIIPSKEDFVSPQNDKFKYIDQVNELFTHYMTYLVDMRCIGAVFVNNDIDFGDFVKLSQFGLNELLQESFYGANNSATPYLTKVKGDANNINVSDGKQNLQVTDLFVNTTTYDSTDITYISNTSTGEGLGLYSQNDIVVMFDNELLTSDAVFAVNAGDGSDTADNVFYVNGLKRADSTTNGLAWLPNTTIANLNTAGREKAVPTVEWVLSRFGAGTSFVTNESELLIALEDTTINTIIVAGDGDDGIQVTTMSANIGTDGNRKISVFGGPITINTSLTLTANTTGTPDDINYVNFYNDIRYNEDTGSTYQVTGLISTSARNISSIGTGGNALTVVNDNLTSPDDYDLKYERLRSGIILGDSLFSYWDNTGPGGSGDLESVGNNKINISDNTGRWKDTAITVDQDDPITYTNIQVASDFSIGSTTGVTDIIAASDNVINIGDGTTDKLIINNNDSTITAPQLDLTAITNGGEQSLVTKKYIDDIGSNSPDTIRYVASGSFNTQKILEIESGFGNSSAYIIPDAGEYTITLLGAKVYATLSHHQLSTNTPEEFSGVLCVTQHPELSISPFTFSNIAPSATATPTAPAVLVTANDVMSQLEPYWDSGDDAYKGSTTLYYVTSEITLGSPIELDETNGKLLFAEFAPFNWQFEDLYVDLIINVEKI
jgi:hypothetical protein